LIEAAYTQAALPVWTEDEAGPYQTLPYPGAHWQPRGLPIRYPHDYLRRSTAKQLTLFYPKSGAVRVKGVRRATNAVLHPWLEAELAQILAALPAPTEVLSVTENRHRWERWQEGLTVRITLPEVLPPLRMLHVARTGQSHRPSHAVVGALVVRTRHHAALHAAERQLAEYGGIDSAHPHAARVGRSPPTDAGGDHRVVGGDCRGVEPDTDTICLGWQTAGATGAGAAATPRARWVRSVY
jgi:hypothetical protein